ncbi:E3 ubiquitin-protein ligase MARCHF4-like [Rhincodon typus]|uniref:E3 ubiquitin-protein ligase MARCHF4-like n=1 Tax=Rhincodon typus TaxID=259920 RepID=UPI0020306EED|nr:E3 ubiquitin-protein ligase MARCHF4-like [Rhincodon typus]
MEEENLLLLGDLLSPCRCAGSVRCTHQPCLIKWISERGSWSCELCYYKYHVIAISAKNPLQWQAISLTVIERVQIAAAILGSLFLIASISWLIWSTISPSAKWQRQDLLFQICYGMYGFMDIVCIVLGMGNSFRAFHFAVLGNTCSCPTICARWQWCQGSDIDRVHLRF